MNKSKYIDAEYKEKYMRHGRVKENIILLPNYKYSKDAILCFSKKHNLEIISTLGIKPYNFSSLLTLGISSKVLSDHLKQLEKSGLIIREVNIKTHPITVKYSLTEVGKKFYEFIR